MSYGRCYCDTGRACPRHEREIEAAEHERDYPTPDDSAADAAADRWETATRLGER